MDAVNLPGLFVKRILKFWPVGDDQLVVRAVLGGAGVKRTNNQVLLLRKADGKWQVLLRTGDAAPGVALATVSKLSAVEVDRMNGHYAVLGALTGTSARANQALWMGQTSLGDDTARAVERLPRLVLRKGDIYTTAVTPADPIRGLVMNPVDEKMGAGARGQGQMVGGDGSVAITIIGRQKVVVRTNISVRLRTLLVTIVRDRKVRELVVVEP